MRSLRGVLSLIVIIGALPAGPARAVERTVTLRGGGWGHGIGMSQYGAYGMARAGKTPAQISAHYYRGTNLGTKSDIPSTVRVGLLQYQSEIQAKSSTLSPGGTITFKVSGRDEVIARSGTGATWGVRPSSTGGMQLYKNGNRHRYEGRSVFGSPTRPLVMRYEPFNSLALVVDTGKRYKYGNLQFGTHRSSECSVGYCTRLVLSLPMEKYIYGLGEMPSSWHRNALKVQAIAGRTYAYRRIKASGQHRVGCDCALVDTPHDQAYDGDAKRDSSPLDGKADTYWSNWKAAVDETAGRLILYNGSPIQALYSSSSGGHTENNENVWGGGALPYLRGVKDPYDDVVVNGSHVNPNHKWTVSMTWSALSSKFNEEYGTGSLQDIQIVKPLGVSGRVTAVRSDGTGGVKVVGSNKTLRLDGWTVRSLLRLNDTLFTMEVFYPVGDRFKERYQNLNGAPGRATSTSYAVPIGWDDPRGRAQNFEVGRMTWTRSTGKVVWQRGPILERYNRFGREKSPLGMPSSDIWGPGASQHLGASYAHGRILYSKATGAWAIWATFVDAFSRSGGSNGRLKLPLAHRQENATTLPDGGQRQRFQEGTIYRDPKPAPVGTYFLWGAIDAKYRAIGQASSKCGYPIQDMEITKTGARAVFEHGEITSAADVTTVACG